MHSVPEQLASATNAKVETFATIANAAFAGAERLMALNLGAARSLLEDSTTSIRVLLAAKDVQDLFSLQNSLAQPGPETATAYSGRVLEIAIQTQEALSGVVEARVSELNKAFALALEKTAQQAMQIVHQANPAASLAAKPGKKAA